MTTQTIKVEGLPEGWKAVAYRTPANGENYLTPDGFVVVAQHDYMLAHLIVEKIQPRRIVLEQIPMDSVKLGDFMRPPGSHALLPVGSEGYNESYAFLREVNETDLSLNSDEPKLSLSVDECKYILGKFQSAVTLNIYDRLREFIKENS